MSSIVGMVLMYQCISFMFSALWLFVCCLLTYNWMFSFHLDGKNSTPTFKMNSDGYTVEVTSLSPIATEKDVYDFFAFSGTIEHVEIVR